MDKNREFAELVGIPWHDEEFDMPTSYYDTEKKEWVHGVMEIRNSDFADPRMVLREMMKREDFYEFMVKSGVGIGYKSYNWIGSDYILDTTGKLRDAAILFLKG